MSTDLSNDEIKRYGRHLILPEIGMAGQLKLKSAKVILIGMGGLGAPLGMYLAAAGVGTIGLVDFDKVDYSNLQRQITFNTNDVGKNKLQAAKERLWGINPEITINLHETKLTSHNAMNILQDYDVIADGTDNFPSRYLINDACVFLDKPNIHGSIFRFDGQISVFHASQGACYRCLYPEPPPQGLVPSCAEGGVLGVLPGVIGSIQALETIKLILNIGKTLINRLIVFDALKMTFKEILLKKNPNCPLCSANPTITKLLDYEEFCTAKENIPRQNTIEEIDPLDLKKRIDNKEDIFILDVREPFEHKICSIAKYLIPLGELPKRLQEINNNKEIVVYCKSGLRSKKAVKILKDAGFITVKNLTGGIDAWADKIDSTLTRY